MLLAIEKLLGWHPPVGIFIAILAVLGVAVPWFRGGAGKREKAIWTAIMFGLVGLELRSIVLFDSDQRAVERQNNERFQEIADGLQTTIANSQAQFTATMAKMRGLAGLSQQSLDETTGGQSFCYVEMRNGAIGSPVVAFVTGMGKHPLSGINIRIAEFGGSSFGLGKEIALLPPAHYAGSMMPLYSFTVPDGVVDKRYNIFISALNGRFIEHMLLHRPPDVAGWSSVFRFKRYSTTSQMVMVWFLKR